MSRCACLRGGAGAQLLAGGKDFRLLFDVEFWQAGACLSARQVGLLHSETPQASPSQEFEYCCQTWQHLMLSKQENTCTR